MGAVLMMWIGLAVGLALLAPVVGARLLPLAGGRLGWVPYLSNIAATTVVKKAGLQRPVAEGLAVLLGLGVMAFAEVPSTLIAITALAIVGLEHGCRVFERRILASPYAVPGVRKYGEAARAHAQENGAASRLFPGPTVHPVLTITARGPFRRRMPTYDLGTLLVGSRVEVRLLVGNHSKFPTQTAVTVGVTAPAALKVEDRPADELPRLCPGDAREWRIAWRVEAASPPDRVRFDVRWGESRHALEIHFEARKARPETEVRSAVIERYEGGCRSAFAWRGDMDLYDETTLQSIEGLEVAFGLAARYRMPQSMYLSTRLSLDPEAARAFGEHYGADRGDRRIPAFVEWMRDNVDLRHSATYPTRTEKRFVVELGNHGHLHFGTDTAAARENGWRPGSRMGAGRYPWLGPESGSLAEQRDNALEAARLCESSFGFRPRSWAMPDRTNDASTPRAMEEAGCEVLSDSNVGAIHNVLFQPPPHHPGGTRAVELTKRFPGDPLDVFDVAMNVFWIHRAHRLGIPLIFMCHQHLRMYESEACPRLTEYILRYALERFNGDLHVNTVYGIGKYWREVLSPLTRTVTVRPEGRRVVVGNGSDQAFEELPVEVELTDGTKLTRLVSVPAGDECAVDVFS